MGPRQQMEAVVARAGITPAFQTTNVDTVSFDVCEAQPNMDGISVDRLLVFARQGVRLTVVLTPKQK